MSTKQTVEDIKRESRGLRGGIVAALKDQNTDHFESNDANLLKFHGSYQEDNRDLRAERRKQKLEKAYEFMVRTKMPGGTCTAAQYLAHEALAEEIGSGTIRLTTRQGFQIHGIVKNNLQHCIATIRKHGMTTWGACGDIVRNTMGPASPIQDAAHQDARALAQEISDAFLAKTSSYTQIWVDGDPLDPGEKVEVEEDPIYKDVYLPRKFKIAIAIPPRNDVDIYSQDLGLAPHLADGKVEGYTVLVGGGFGMSHGKIHTRPVLAKPLFYVKREAVVEACVAIVTTQRDHGNREDRSQARMKYLIEEKGVEWFRNEVTARMKSPTFDAKELAWDTVEDLLGWHEQGDGKLFCGIWVDQGRIKDDETVQYRSAFRKIAETIGSPVCLTPNTNIIFHDIDPAQKEAVDRILQDHGITNPETLTAAKKVAHACVALPTCGLALGESERVFSGVMDKIDVILKELGLEKEPILFRMTGCPNGCARPYNADFAFVGRGPGKYAFYLGGSVRGTRLSGLQERVIALEEIPDKVRPFLQEFAEKRQDGELFSDFWGRTHENGEAPTPEQFHVELAQRDAKATAQT